MGWDANPIPWGPGTSFPGPKRCHPCFPISKGQLSSLSRGNLAHSARVTRPTKAAMPSGHQHRLRPGRCLSDLLILLFSLLSLSLLNLLSSPAPDIVH